MRTEGQLNDPRATFHVTCHDDVERVLRDSKTFSSSINGEVIGQYMGELILAMDGQEHKQYRGLVSHAFRASSLARWDRELVVAAHGVAARRHRTARAGRPGP